ncbi:hypothetical protein [Sphingobium nicotianae]|uniref:Uncharacterized protein n=1 Tax=Sphingobium nicotianae TaxID=2782607 RepID=A0A9X1DCU1_9SPHN|nr:hypothetical protein [Sphingobium nicotianae]MBT2187795.1 hypothetical protein [Sphingobium nicotianae]
MELHNSEHYNEIAGALRLRARHSGDLDLARRLREAAIKHERHARRLEWLEAGKL